MDQIRVVGGKSLKGEIKISGAKNAALPLMTACLLTDQPFELDNVPQLADIKSMTELLNTLGVEVQQPEPNAVTFTAKDLTSTTAPYELVSKMRASILVLGPLLAREGKARVSLPGGCVIGQRPVDLHISSLRELGAEIELHDGYIEAKAPNGLKGAKISFPMVTVTGTENLMMAAALAKGTTTLINAAREPEIIDLANCLNAMGAKITGAGTDTLVIEGVEKLGGVKHSVIADRIETGTYVVASAITGGELHLTNTSIDLLPAFTSIMQKAGVELQATEQGIRVLPPQQRTDCVDVSTKPYPGFATDIQAQTMALMAVSKGACTFTENIFENRFMHVPELCRMGADIKIHNNSTAMVRGVEGLKGAQVMATDIRASFSLVIAALAATGETSISRVYHLDRGYEKVEEKLQACGAEIERVSSSEAA